MNEPLISVVITCGAAARRVVPSMQSVQAQTYQNWEAVVVDGGLPEESLEAIGRLARGDSRIRLVHDPAVRGTPAARNAGVQISRGEWVAFLDSGERLLPHSLAVRFELAHQRGFEVVHSDGYAMQDDEPAPMALPPLQGPVYRELLEDQGPIFPGLLVHKSLLEDCRYLDQRLEVFQAWDLTIRLAHNHPFGFEVVPTFVTDGHGDCSTAAEFARKAREYERVIAKHRLGILRTGGAGLLRRHYGLAADWHERGGQPASAARCRGIAFLCGCADRLPFRRKTGRLWSSTKAPDRHTPAVVARPQPEAAEVSIRLSELLKVPVHGLTLECCDGQSGLVHRVQFRDDSAKLRAVVLKKVDTAFPYEFYRQILEPFALDAPHTYGTIHTAAGDFLVIDYIAHDPARWTDHDKFRAAVRWLAKKDTIVHEHFARILHTGLLSFAPERPPWINAIEDCIQIIRKGVEQNVSPLLTPLLLDSIVRRRQVLHGLAADIFRNSRLTVSHRDFHVRNVLFPLDDRNRVYVVDWSNPEIDSVCIDLARLALSAPPPIRRELVDLYRSRIDFEGFERTYHQAEVVITLAQFAWMFSALVEGRRGPLNAAELRRARTLAARLIASLKLGLD